MRLKSMTNQDFNSDGEFAANYIALHAFLKSKGWKATTKALESRKVSMLFTKDGYGVYVLYGCEEDIKEEIL